MEYWENTDELIDYLLIDYILEIARRKFPAAAEAMRAGAINNGHYRKLNEALKAGLPQVGLEQIIPDETVFNTLDWTKNYPLRTADGEEAVYSAFLKYSEADIEYLKKCR